MIEDDAASVKSKSEKKPRNKSASNMSYSYLGEAKSQTSVKDRPKIRNAFERTPDEQINQILE